MIAVEYFAEASCCLNAWAAALLPIREVGARLWICVASARRKDGGLSAKVVENQRRLNKQQASKA